MPRPANPRPKVNATPTNAEMQESARIEAALNETGATSAAGLRAAGKTREANLADKQTGGVKDAAYSSAKFDSGVTSAKVTKGTKAAAETTASAD